MPLGAVRGFFSFLAAFAFGVDVAAPSSFRGRPRPFLLGSTSALPAAALSLSAPVAATAFFPTGPFFFFAAAVGAAPPTFFGRPRPSLAFLGGSSSASSSAARFAPVLGASVSSLGSSSSASGAAWIAVSISSCFSGTLVVGLAPPFSHDPV